MIARMILQSYDGSGAGDSPHRSLAQGERHARKQKDRPKAVLSTLYLEVHQAAKRCCLMATAVRSTLGHLRRCWCVCGMSG